MTDQMDTLIHKLMEVFEDPESPVLDEVLSPDIVIHAPEGPPLHGSQAAREMIRGMRQAFPDMTFEIDDIITEESKVACRWTVRGTHRGEFMGVPPTGKSVEIDGIEIARVEDGKFVEDWLLWDALGLLRQLGALPST